MSVSSTHWTPWIVLVLAVTVTMLRTKPSALCPW